MNDDEAECALCGDPIGLSDTFAIGAHGGWICVECEANGEEDEQYAETD